MLDVCAPGWEWHQAPHFRRILANNRTYPSLPKHDATPDMLHKERRLAPLEVLQDPMAVSIDFLRYGSFYDMVAEAGMAGDPRRSRRCLRRMAGPRPGRR